MIQLIEDHAWQVVTCYWVLCFIYGVAAQWHATYRGKS